MDNPTREQLTQWKAERENILRDARQREIQANEMRLSNAPVMLHDTPQGSNRRVVRWWPKERARNGER